jgi:hypothetical protein
MPIPGSYIAFPGNSNILYVPKLVLRFTLKEKGFKLGLLMRLSSALQPVRNIAAIKKTGKNFTPKENLRFINL